MRYLITGGAGFIGSHLSDELLRRGHRVHVLDDLSTGAMENIRHLKERPGFEYVIESAAIVPVVAELVDEADVVYHLAAAVGVELIVDSPVRTIETNVHATEVVLNAANKKKKPVFVASTSEVYGKSADIPFREDGDLLLGPTVKGRWSYACSKAIDEFLALAYWKERKLPTVVARLFNTVGPRQTGRYGMVVPRFVRQALAGEDLSWLEGHAILFGKNIPYLPIIDILKQAFAIQEGDDDHAILRRVDRATGSWESAARATMPYLKYLLNVDPGDQTVATMDPMARRHWHSTTRAPAAVMLSLPLNAGDRAQRRGE